MSSSPVLLFSLFVAGQPSPGSSLKTEMPPTGESVLLAPTYEKGGVDYLEFVQQIEQVGKGGAFGPAGRGTRSSRTKGAYQKVATTSEQGTRLVFTFDRVAMQAESPGGNLAFDSDIDDRTDKAHPVAAVLGPMIGMSVTFELDIHGHVKSSKGMEAIYDKVQKEAVGSPILNQLQDDLSSEAAQLTWADGRFVLFANKTVKVGDTWSGTVRTRSAYLGDLVREYRCKLDRFDTDNGRRVAVVTYSADIRRPPDAVPGMFAVSAIKSGRLEGTANFDTERREFTYQSEAINLVLEAAVSGPEPQKKTPIEIQSTTRQILRLMTELERSQQKLANFTRAKRGAPEPAKPPDK